MFNSQMCAAKYPTLSKYGSRLIHILLVYGMLSLLQPVLATVAVTSGANQTVPAGSDSEDIVFSFVNEQGNPITAGSSVNFSLVDSASNPKDDGITALTAETDDNGQVSTRFKGTGTMGGYTITATLATDTSQFASTYLVVIVGTPAKLTVTAGSGQLITVDEGSANIVFELTDAYANVITAAQFVNFTLTTPSGDTTTNGIFPEDDALNSKGQVVTRLDPTATKGDYTVTATLMNDNTVTGNTIVTVIEPAPELPLLGDGAAINIVGIAVNTNASFNGGIQVNASNFTKDATLNSTDSVVIRGVINVASADIGKAADILVVGAYTPPGTEIVYYHMVDENNDLQLWDVDMAHLVPFTKIEKLAATQSANMYGGPLPPGKVQVYFGYRLDNGEIVYNGANTINATIK